MEFVIKLMKIGSVQLIDAMPYEIPYKKKLLNL